MREVDERIAVLGEQARGKRDEALVEGELLRSQQIKISLTLAYLNRTTHLGLRRSDLRSEVTCKSIEERKLAASHVVRFVELDSGDRAKEGRVWWIGSQGCDAARFRLPSRQAREERSRVVLVRSATGW